MPGPSTLVEVPAAPVTRSTSAWLSARLTARKQWLATHCQAETKW